MKPPASWLHTLVGRLLSPCSLGCQGRGVDFLSFGHCQWLRPEEQMRRAIPPRGGAYQMWIFSWDLSLQALASLVSRGMDERQQPYARTHGRYSTITNVPQRLLCVWLPPSSQKGFWGLYRIIINSCLTGHEIDPWACIRVECLIELVCEIFIYSQWKEPFVGSSQHTAHLFHANIYLSRYPNSCKETSLFLEKGASMFVEYTLEKGLPWIQALNKHGNKVSHSRS